MSAWLAAQAWVELLYLDVVGLRGFSAVHQCVSRTRPRAVEATPETITAIVESTKTAIALYFKGAQCLQRSAVVTRLLRRHGVKADMMIGCRVPPLEAHAWVEVAGDVVSDYQDGIEYFRVMDRW